MTFRIRMARQEGEKTADRFGFNAFPIDPFAIAKREEIDISARPPDVEGVSGGIVLANDCVFIFYATNIPSVGFQRFTVAHELGHYFLPGHLDHIEQKTAGHHASRAGFRQGADPIEIEADHFASGLLLPTTLVRGVLNSATIGLEGIQSLSEQAECSMTASAIRAAECAEHPMAVIMSQGGQVCYGFMSDSFKVLRPGGFLRKGNPLPRSLTSTLNADSDRVLDGDRDCGQTDMADWFGGRSLALDEEVLGLGRYGYTLTVLSSEALCTDPDDEQEDDEDSTLVDKWTPRFAYGR